MVDDVFGYIALEMIGGDVDGSPDLAISWTFYADRFNVCRNAMSVPSRSATLICAASSMSTGIALLASRISTRWCHELLGGCLGRVKAGGGSEVGCAGGWVKRREMGTNWFYRSWINTRSSATQRHRIG